MTDLFMEAARDVEAEHLALRIAQAKVAVADLWPFLALSRSEREFGHRLALVHDRIAEHVPEDLMQITVTALQDDFAEMARYRAEETPAAPRTAAVVDTPVQAGQQIWHQGQRRWVTVTAGQESGLPDQPKTRHNQYGNPGYFEQAAEEGPNTESTGQFAQFPAGPDPVDPLNSMFPAQPQPWTVPPNAGWVERPMNLTPGAGRKSGSRPSGHGLGGAATLAQSAARSVLASAGYVDEGVQTGPGPNPGYFAGGSEGIGGDPQAGFPEDLAVQDPDDRMNELYGAVPPQQSSGSGQGGAEPYSNPGVARQASFHDPADASVRVVAQEGAPGTVGTAPEPPQSMTPGGVGSMAQDPLPPGATSSGNPADPGGADQASKQFVASIAKMAADNIRQRPTDANPTGVQDEYDDNTWEGQASTRPRQPAQDRGINTPQTPRDPIPQTSSSDFQRELSEDERRLVQGTARRAAQDLVGASR